MIIVSLVMFVAAIFWHAVLWYAVALFVVGGRCSSSVTRLKGSRRSF